MELLHSIPGSPAPPQTYRTTTAVGVTFVSLCYICISYFCITIVHMYHYRTADGAQKCPLGRTGARLRAFYLLFQLLDTL